ncbi:MAG TPA: NAD-glutamate dehydrogenase domain-containing protein [Candidatus Krumholzibacteria bacterium]|nr:NAD-glutamate dehydrogenase domain-containing protein [Candidatus Krumholzibacteria bacterium]
MTTPTANDLVREVESSLESYEPSKNVDAQAYRDLAQAVAKRADENFLLQEDGTLWLQLTERLLACGSTRRDDTIVVEVMGGKKGGSRGHTVVCTCMPDQAFIIDSVRLAFRQLGLELYSQVNVVLPVERDTAGKVARMGDSVGDDGTLESWALFEVDSIADPKRRRALKQDVTDRLRRAQAVARDFRRQLRQLKDLVNQVEFLSSVQPDRREELDEVRHFLEWLSEDHFVFFGMTPVDVRGEPTGEALGLSRLREDPFSHSYPDARRWLKSTSKRGPLVHISKTSEESELHRSGKIDEILVRTHSDRGEVTGAVAIHGLFTYRAIQSRGSIVPILREKLNEVVRQEDVTPGSFNYKAIVNAFNSLPVEYLFGADPNDIRELIRRTLAADRARKLEVYLSLGSSKRTAFVFVVMPRAQFNDQRRERIQEYLMRTLEANYADHRVLLHSYGVAVVHFYLTSPRRMKAPSMKDVEAEIVSLSATWEDRLRDALLDTLSRDEAMRLYGTYHGAFSGRYQLSTAASQVIIDLLNLEAIRRGSGLDLALYRDEEDVEQGTMKLRLYSDHDLMLSDIMPILDNFGLRVVNSFSNHARLDEGVTLTLETFRFELPDPALADDPQRQGAFLDALRAVFRGDMANDALNRVLIPAGLDWRQVVILRSYQGYAKQLGNMTTPGSVYRVLVKHAPIVRRIVELFEAKFGPARNGRVPARPSARRRKTADALLGEIIEAVDRVESSNEDRVLRIFVNLVDATLRTSFYARDREYPSVAHKFDCAQVASMPDRRPWREIYVHHSNLEGVHLRGGRIARGGLRWSDRLDDFRTEILGLMTTQMVKNVVIVPLGAKGGFVVKRLPSDPAARRAAADDHYEIFIQSLLDLSDNRIEEEIVPPCDVVCWDEPDPYLVVAADKGTAHLSDRANAISEKRAFWLGDAFASGGSNGYDHKAIGITARGTWVAVRHILREAGINAETDEFTVAGIGDMGGDVFGNGLIEHPTIKLQAAFNHLHIFLDPDPDPKKSFKERKRLFRARSSGWDAYDTSVISKGGGIFDRHAKRIPLSAPVRRMLGVEETEMSGSELVRTILRMPVDLLYNGGIGTYVKASQESHAQAADPANDSVRIDASELQCKTVGEGGNLGLTQAARIEFARNGGRINTDFIDNAGGVNISDHEVNLKILFATQVQAGRLSMRSRNQLLPDIEPTVTQDVLVAQGDQARMLSLDERRSRFDLAPFDRVMDEIARYFSLSRRQVDLPPVREMDRRMAEGEALTRPELATLSSFVKMRLYEELLEDPKLDMEGLLPALRNYFPAKVRKRFAKAVDEHSLRREIALTRLTNRIVDHTGCTFFHEMHADCGANSRQTFEAYSFLSRAADLWRFKDELWSLGWKVEVEVLYEALLIVEHALRLGTRHLLEHWSEAEITAGLRQTGPHSRKILGLESDVESVLDQVSLERVRERVLRFTEAGIPGEMATRLAHVRYLPRALVVLDLAGQCKRSAKAVAADYFALGRASRLFDVIRWIDELRPDAYYDALAYRALRRELHELLSRLVLRLLPVSGSAQKKLESLGPGREAFAQLERIPPEQLGPAALMVVVQDMRQALGQT